MGLALLDRAGSLFGRPPLYLPNSGGPGDLAVGATEDALFGLKLMTPREPVDWHNRVAARSLLSVAAHRPVRRVAERAPHAELFGSRGGHYDVYEGGQDHVNVLNVEVAFLHRHAQ
jgi:hypothetical protein